MAFPPISPLTTDGLNKFLSLGYHQMISWSIYTFAELGLADQLIHAKPNCGLTVDEIIGENRKQWNSQLLYRLLQTCVYGGIVELINDDHHFLLTQSGMMLTSDHSSHVRDQIRFLFGPIITGASLQLPSIIRGEGSGTGVARVSGGLDFFTLLSQPDQKELASVFNGAMTTFSLQTGEKLVTGVDFGRFKTIVDIGGSRGTFLAQILEQYPSIEHGIVFDVPHVIDQSNHGDEFKSRGINEKKWSFIAGDMYDSSTIPLADAYIMKHILHDYDDKKCLEILSSLRQAIRNRKNSPTTIFIVEYVILSDGTISNWQIRGFDIAMAIALDNARERTQNEYEDLLKKTGFEIKTLYPIQAPSSVIEATFVNN